ncbi:hypothetical protein [Methanosarcina horonobensis]|uniref:hypothetical protein n=1 Tax=Methanosarcina horonobensis TaxID=418008 RepID=UPI0022B912D5|nr:hypothetical protein [Methanosarcina horonobensis]
MIVFALWYGIWGVLSAYLGCMIGAGVLADMPFSLNVIWSTADLWQALIPLTAFAYFKANIRLRTKRDWGIFLLFGCFLNNLIGALWGALTIVVVGMVPGTEFFCYISKLVYRQHYYYPGDRTLLPQVHYSIYPADKILRPELLDLIITKKR